MFQKKAWIDAKREKFVLQKQVFPYKEMIQQQNPDANVELLLQQDNVSGHFSPQNLRLCSENGVLALGSPPGLTNYIQLIDRDVGKSFRSDVYDKIEEAVEKLENDARQRGDLGEKGKIKLSAMQRRVMVAEKVAAVLKLWREEEKKRAQIRTAADRKPCAGNRRAGVRSCGRLRAGGDSVVAQRWSGRFFLISSML